MEKPITLAIESLSHDGKGVGRYEGMVVFVEGALPGEEVRVCVKERKKGYAEAVLIDVIRSSPHRRSSPCAVYDECGGCQLLHLEYLVQLDAKTALVKNQLLRIGGFKDVKVNPCIGMDEPWGYRNKVVFQVSYADNFKLGFYAGRTNDFIPQTCCLLARQGVKAAAWSIETAINMFSSEFKGLSRVLIRESNYDGKILIGLIFEKKHPGGRYIPFVDMVKTEVVNLEGVVEYCSPNPKVYWEGNSRLIFGKDHFIEKLGNYRFKVSAASFFQVNSLQSEKLFETTKDFCTGINKPVILDLYCGTGTIGLFLSGLASKVYGIDSLPEAIEDARANASLNNVENVTFLCGRAEEEVSKLLKDGVYPDIVVVDPPRKGCHPGLLDCILDIRPQRVIYVSCNPSTLARDLKRLASEYTIDIVQPVDMFPHTVHVECVIGMQRKDT
ncbi:MAG: 23S rRNA (uracil(1939)-C(5))-methyltransferase RlmD [Bacillota bacterium]